MNYEKAYKDALERMKSWARGEHPECFTEAQKAAEFIFPELRDSEDEKIRKEILEFVTIVADSKSNKMEWIVWLEKQGKQPKKVSVWKHWKDGIAGNAEGKQIFLIKIGSVYSISSCLGCECDYIELSELDKLMREEKQGWKRWNEEDIKFIDMLIKEKEDAIDLSCDVKESISLIYCCNALKLIKQRMKEQL